MSKSPAFQFYPDDFVGGKVGMMTPEEVGVYVLLLCLDWNQGGFIEDVERLARWCRIPPRRFAVVWAVLRENFTERDGRFFNGRLEQERAKQEEWRIKSSEGGKKGAQHRWQPELANGDKGGHKGGHTKRIRVAKAPPIPIDDIPFPSPSPVTTKSLSGADAPDKNWVASATDIFLAVGTFPHGRIGKALSPVVQQYGWPDVERGLRDYVAAPKNGRHRTPEYFAQESGTWVVGAREPMADRDGVPTARADRLLGVAS